MTKKVFFVSFLLMVLIISGCQSKGSIGEKNIKGFLQELYQVESTAEYQELMGKIEQYFQDKPIESDAKLLTIDPADQAEIFKTYIEKYRQFCTEPVLQVLFKNRYITKYEQLAFDEGCQFYVKDISLEQDKKNETQYYYTINVEKKLKDGTSQLQSGQGMITLNAEGFVDKFTITQHLKF